MHLLCRFFLSAEIPTMAHSALLHSNTCVQDTAVADDYVPSPCLVLWRRRRRSLGRTLPLRLTPHRNYAAAALCLWRCFPRDNYIYVEKCSLIQTRRYCFGTIHRNAVSVEDSVPLNDIHICMRTLRGYLSSCSTMRREYEVCTISGSKSPLLSRRWRPCPAFLSFSSEDDSDDEEDERADEMMMRTAALLSPIARALVRS